MTATARALPPARARGAGSASALPRLVLVLVALLGSLFLAASPASAHAALTASDPADGAVVATAPDQITLSFSEQVAMDDDSIRVLDPQGTRVDTGELRDMCSGNVIRYGTALRPGLGNGTYTVAWQAVSADSHPVSGAFTFSIGAPSATDVSLPTRAAGGGPVGAAYEVARFVSYAGFTVLVGGAAFILVCMPGGAGLRPLQKLVVRAWVALTAATLAMLVLRAPYTGSGRFADVFDLDGLRAVLGTKTGASLVSRLLLLGAVALFLAVLFGVYARRRAAAEEAGAGGERDRDLRDLTFGLGIGGAVVAAGIAATWALSEHASTGIQPAIAMPVDILHLLAVAAWLGGLTALLVVLYRGPGIEREAVRRFSSVAFGSVVVLVLTGIYQSWRQVGSWSALTGTDYGRLLLLKIGLVVVLVGTASISRRWTARLAEAPAARVSRETARVGAGAPAEEETAEAAEETGTGTGGSVDPRRAAQLARQRAARDKAREKKDRDSDGERSGLRRSVLVEAGIAIVLLVVTTLLTTTEPGRTAEKEAGRTGASTAVPNRPVKITLPFDTGGANGKGTVRVELDPGRTGANTLHVWAENPQGAPMDLAELKVAFTLPANELGPLPAVPDHLAPGHWSASGVRLPLAGSWRIDVTVRTSDIDQTTVDKTVKIG
ncbi:copper resistance CopC/CopD family protein [Streptomyces sp. BI20]|uniref:copper resistance CopC/CopD family protein n=1 Tax=Streptomyces sp. BI20 TaxID=3403460 RepID=UPI003C73BAA1